MSASFSQHNRIVPIEPLTGLELNESVLHLPEDRHVDMRLDDVTERSLQARLEQPCLFVERVFRNRADHFCQTHHSLPVVSYLACHRARLMGDLQPEIVTGLGISTGAGT